MEILEQTVTLTNFSEFEGQTLLKDWRAKLLIRSAGESVPYDLYEGSLTDSINRCFEYFDTIQSEHLDGYVTMDSIITGEHLEFNSPEEIEEAFPELFPDRG